MAIPELAPHGLAVTGAFRPDPGDGHLPPGTATLALVGADGDRMWPAFRSAPEAGDGRPDPLDRWSRRVLTAVAAEIGATALFPFGGPPWLPFVRWAAAAENAAPSPVAMLATGARGLWTSWRGALALTWRLETSGPRPHPCRACAAPCRTACPVDAFAGGRYDISRCVGHVGSPAGAACRDGCLVRRACPPGQAATPPGAQRRHHMLAFLAEHGSR